jgi:protein-tyrosine-phosphatase
VCRSPLAERLARAHLDRLFGHRAHDVEVSSAGSRAVAGSAMDPHSARVLRRLGGNAEGFCARQLSEGMAATADLTLTMTTHQREYVLGRAPRALRKTFTLLEAAALSDLVEDLPPGLTPAAHARDFVGRLAEARRMRAAGDDDIPDPIGLRAGVHQQVGSGIAEALLPLLDRMFGVGVESFGPRPPATVGA